MSVFVLSTVDGDSDEEPTKPITKSTKPAASKPAPATTKKAATHDLFGDNSDDEDDMFAQASKPRASNVLGVSRHSNHQLFVVL